MKLLLASAIFLIVEIKSLSDDVFYPTTGITWSSVTFDIPVAVAGNNVWPNCRKVSKFYCLSDYRTNIDGINPAIEFRNVFLLKIYRDLHQKFLLYKHNARRASAAVFGPKYQQYNFFVKVVGCCAGQFDSYYVHGLQGLKIKPEEYFSRLTDYTEENKNLNLLWSIYLDDCDVYIITKLGFGEGHLKRSHFRNGFPSQNVDTPYRLQVGETWSPDIPYEHPDHFLTFNWFKKNVMCQDQPWICGEVVGNHGTDSQLDKI